MPKIERIDMQICIGPPIFTSKNHAFTRGCYSICNCIRMDICSYFFLYCSITGTGQEFMWSMRGYFPNIEESTTHAPWMCNVWSSFMHSHLCFAICICPIRSKILRSHALKLPYNHILREIFNITPFLVHFVIWTTFLV